MSNIITVRDIDTVTAEIVTIHKHTQRLLLTGAIEIGRRLVEAKSMVNHGEWGAYLEERLGYKSSTANNLMKLYEEYGDNQESLFDNFANSQTFQNLTYTKALAMLALPADLRQTFAEENDVEHMSTREVQGAVQEELEKLKAEKAQAEKKLDEACEHNDDLRQRLDEERVKREDLQEQTGTLGVKIDRLQKEKEKAELSEQNALRLVEKLNKKVAAAEKAEQAAKEALKKAQENPEIPDTVMEEMRQQVAADAAAKATEDLQKQLAAAESAAKDATAQKEIAEVQIEELEKQLQAASPNMIRLGAYLEAMQEAWEKFVDVLKDIREEDPETAAKLKANTKVKVLDPMINQIDGV